MTLVVLSVVVGITFTVAVFASVMAVLLAVRLTQLEERMTADDQQLQRTGQRIDGMARNVMAIADALRLFLTHQGTGDRAAAALEVLKRWRPDGRVQ